MRARRLLAVAALAAGLVAATPAPATAQSDPCAARPGYDPRSPQYVCALYEAFLHSPTEAEVTYWVGAMGPDPGVGTDLTQLVQAIVGEREGLTNDIAALYDRYLHRPADPFGLRGWVDLLTAPSTRLEQVELALLASNERICAAPSTDAYVADLYRDVLGRVGAPGEVRSWAELVDDGRGTFESVAVAILGSDEHLARRATALYELLGRPASGDEVAFWAGQIAERGYLLARAGFLGSPEAYRTL